ncbi:MAG: pyridoxal-phosphate dependent enzyme, partial [Lachnospiraceae bacterium]|nr:pyridoxal-phosphate dependent enzyme [Lachnospiraceae bacterium]
MRYYNDVREIVGKTPLLKLNRIGRIGNVNIYAKLEYLNPGGSMKDRIG